MVRHSDTFMAMGPAGGGRVMQCLLENTGQPEFGHQCMAQVAIRDSAMRTDFRENVPLAQACAPEIDTTCAAEKVRPHQSFHQ